MKRWILLITSGFLILFLFYFPMFGASPLGKPIFLKAFGARFHGDVAIDSMHLSWFGPQVFHQVQIASKEYEGTIEEIRTDSPFWSISKVDGTFTIQNGHFSFPAYQGVSVEQVNGRIQDHDLDLQGVSRIGNDVGHFAARGKYFSETHFDLAAQFTDFPTAALDGLLQAQGYLYKGLGPSFNLTGNAKLDGQNGLLDMTLFSPNVETTVKAKFTPEALTLLEPVDARLRLTPELSEAVLSDVNPLFLTGMSAKNPIYLHLSATGSYLPIQPFSLKTLRLAGTLDMGQTVVRNGPSLASLVSILKVGSLSNSSQMNAWFTTLDFQIQNGIVSTGRLDALLADSIHICTWGDINLLNDQLDMILGIPADTLKRSFGIENLSSNYVIKVPIRGTTSHPEIEKGAATAKIAALTATQQIPIKKKTLLGGLVHALAVPKEDSDVPPAKRPFPWER